MANAKQFAWCVWQSQSNLLGARRQLSWTVRRFPWNAQLAQVSRWENLFGVLPDPAGHKRKAPQPRRGTGHLRPFRYGGALGVHKDNTQWINFQQIKNSKWKNSQQ
ncbi:hypothetical protein ElyMa_004504300 [Elysia marginata]|uniref:Uncharacterized protein n=1 Tax=Elysia marginata TaxID=1093978 RepID=A0AAV4HP31_9GAST|nr:hypothetical protein ElyMa_004504300 [Elysia marginata]